MENTNASTVQIASLTAGEQEAIAGITSNTELGISNNQTQASIAQTNASVNIAGIQGSVAKSGQTTSALSGIAGDASMIGLAALAF